MCSHKPGSDQDECSEGARREQPTESCSCIRAAPQVPYPTGERERHARWICTTYSDARCRGAAVGKPCTVDGLHCEIDSNMCVSGFACAAGTWGEVPAAGCRP